MFGLSIAFLIALFQLGFKKENQYTVFKQATKFLFYWYMAAGVCVIGTVGVLLLLFGPLALLAVHVPFVGFLLGVSTLAVILLMMIPYAFEVLGAKLLHESLAIAENQQPAWDMTKVILGGVALGLGLAMIHFLS